MGDFILSYMIFRLVSAKSKRAEIWVKLVFSKVWSQCSSTTFSFLKLIKKYILFLKKSSRVRAACKLLSLGWFEPNISNNMFSHFSFYHFSAPLKSWRRPRRQPQRRLHPLLHLRLKLPQRHRRLPSLCKRPHLVLEASDKVDANKKSLWKLILVITVLFYKVRTRALLITDPTPQPMTSTATMAAAAVSWKNKENFVIFFESLIIFMYMYYSAWNLLFWRILIDSSTSTNFWTRWFHEKNVLGLRIII